ncbi:hypothetical protein CDAR_242661 [Caerostris darwini]|uniref:Ribosomal protein L2 n=1 Tax=Caerostris darwini TaxID=1538125 RepID=A0AAV4N011_9ARAC|nr:hypothetical protein CDAR_242661 [Caerostris darwini]
MQMSSLIHFTHLNRTPHFPAISTTEKNPRPYHGGISFERISRSKRGITALSNRKTVLGTHPGGSSILKEGRLFISNKKGGRNPIKSCLGGGRKGRGDRRKSNS